MGAYVFQITVRLLFACVLLAPLKNYGQTEAYDLTTRPLHGTRSLAEVVDGDTIPLVNLDQVNIYTVYQFRSAKQRAQWDRTRFNVKKVYPYAIIAAAKLKEYDVALAKIHDEHMKKAFVKVCEKDLRSQFENELTNLTVTQGKILMKLIDREAGRTTYEVVKQLRGSFQAAMWQAVATIFGHNMKSEYDPLVEDIMIERAVRLVEAGDF